MTDSRLRIAVAVLALVGIGIATYITVEGKGVACETGGCEKVLTSEWADKLGIETSVLGIFGYALILASTLLPGDASRLSGALLGLVGFGFSAFLTIWSKTTLDTTCQWCLTSAATMTLIAIVTATRLLRADAG